jgi:hypothetical protein
MRIYVLLSLFVRVVVPERIGFVPTWLLGGLPVKGSPVCPCIFSEKTQDFAGEPLSGTDT